MTGVERIAVLRALPGVGDLLCAVPALRAVRRAHPQAQVTLVGLPSAAWFVDRYPELVDDLLTVEGVWGLPEVRPDADAARRFCARAEARHFDLALQLHGSGVTSNPLTTMLRARRQVTAWMPGHWRPPGRSLRYPCAGPEIRRLLAVVREAGCPDVGEETALPLTDDERAEAVALVGGPEAGTYVCLHPGASRTDNRWPAGDFATVGNRLADRGARMVLTGTAGEHHVVRAVAAALDTAPLDLCGRTGVGTLGALFAGARLVLSNDTGASHVAAAVSAPSVIVFPADGDPDRWAPLDRRRHRPVLAPAEAGRRWPGVDAVLAAAEEAVADQ